MEQWLSIRTIRNAVMLVAAVIVVSGSVIGTPRGERPGRNCGERAG